MDSTLELEDGRTLAYRDLADTANGGLTVLWQHGTPGSRLSWLVPHGVRWITFDRAGYGQSSRNVGRTVLDTARDAVALVDHLGLGQVHLGGWSNGGPHALATAALLGERVLGVITVGTASPFASAHLSEEKANRAGTIAADPAAYLAGLEEAVDPIRQMGVAVLAAVNPVPASDAATMQRLESAADASLREAVAQGAIGWFDDHVAIARPDWEVDWTNVTCPVVLLHGGSDEICPLDAAEALAAQLPQATIEPEPEDGHIAPLDRLSDAIDRHWRR